MSVIDRDPIFDVRISDWLEDEPDHVPTGVLETVIAAVPSVPQQRATRVSRGFNQVLTTGRLAVAAALVVGLVGWALLLGGQNLDRLVPSPPPSAPAVANPMSSTQPTPSATPLPTPLAMDSSIVPSLTSRFVSTRYGYTIATKPTWKVTPAKLTWSGPDNSDTVVDQIDLTGTDTTITVASEPLVAPDTFEAWLQRFYVNGLSLPAACTGGDPSTWPPVAVGNAVGRWQQMCNAAEVVVESGGRAYAFTWGNGTVNRSQHLTPEAFRAVLGTVVFDPAAAQQAPLPPPLSQTFVSKKNAFTIHYPAGWHTTAASADWPAETSLEWGDPALDVLQTKSLRLVATSQPLEPGQTPDAWLDWYCATYSPVYVDCDHATSLWQPILIGTVSGWIDTDGIQAVETVATGGRVFDAVVVVDGRAYAFTLDGLVERPLFDALLRSVTFRPD